uniref:Uncharacterized protein n=1 Tax=Avena sativa TaxID=4498 RepID=A0ACD5TBM6_AVESA
MKLWDWDKGWECTQTFNGKHSGYICQVMFNPKNTNSFVTALANHIVEVWDLDSPQCKYTLSGHWDRVNCLDFFTRDDQQYLITGSSDCSAKIWDMHNNVCIHTLHASMSPVMSVLFHPSLQFLLTGLEDGTVHLWSSTNFRLERIINAPVSEPGGIFTWIRNLFVNKPESGPVWGLACSVKSKGFVFGRGEMVAVVDIDNVNNQKELTNDSVAQLSVDMGPGDTTTQMIQGDCTLLEVHPSELHFTLQSTECLLDLTNHTYERVAFRLMQKMKKSEPFREEKENLFFSNLPIYGFIPPRSTCTLVVTKKEQTHPPEDTNLDLLLQSSISGDKFIVPFKYESECVDLFEELKETGNMVHEVTLKVVLDPQGEVTHEIISATKKVDKLGFGGRLVSIDTHPTETWIVTCKFFGEVFIWDLVAQEQKKPLYSFEVKEEYGSGTVKFLKFIARKQWFLAGTNEGFIHVVSYGTETVQEIMSFRASSTYVTSMAIHPTQPYVLSSARDSPIKLWDWDKGWECTRTFEDEQSGTIRQIAFNPVDTNCFASASDDQTVKVWSIDSPKSNYTLFGHLAQVNCLDFFTRGDQQHLISGSDDLTVRIWDLEKSACIYTISALMAPILSVLCLPNRPYLIIGLKDGTLHLFSSANFRLERIIDFGCRNVCSVVLMGSVRVAIVQEGAVSIIDIDNEKPAGIISEVRADVVDAVKLDVASEAQLEAPHIFQEPKEDRPDAQNAVSVTRNLNSTEASDV